MSFKFHFRILIILSILIIITLITHTATAFLSVRQFGPTLELNPSSVTIKVGDSANVNVTLTDVPSNFGQICFGVQEFPESGFITTFVPQCMNSQSSSDASVLTVEATPAAAPQSFTAYVVATNGNWSSKATFEVTVVPAMSAWIPWSIILVFVLILVAPLLIKRDRGRKVSGLFILPAKGQ